MIEVLGQPFFQNALMAGMVVALMCFFLGVYVLLKRVVFVGFALSQIASAGVAVALLLGVSPSRRHRLHRGWGRLLLRIPSRKRIPMEGVIGASYILAAAVGIIAIAKYPARRGAGAAHPVREHPVGGDRGARHCDGRLYPDRAGPFPLLQGIPLRLLRLRDGAGPRPGPASGTSSCTSPSGSPSLSPSGRWGSSSSSRSWSSRR